MTLKNEVEALLFSSGKNMSVEQLTEFTKKPAKDVSEALKQLKEEYANRDSALTILGEDNLWKLHVRQDYLPLVQKIVADTELPTPVLETLAVIAYKQPCLQSDVIKTRGAGAYEHITLLLELEFITREKSGRSFAVKPTSKFFEYFEINKDSLKDIFAGIKIPKPALTEKQEPQKNEEQIKLTRVDHEELDRIRKELEEKTRALEERTFEVSGKVKQEISSLPEIHRKKEEARAEEIASALGLDILEEEQTEAAPEASDDSEESAEERKETGEDE